MFKSLSFKGILLLALVVGGVAMFSFIAHAAPPCDVNVPVDPNVGCEIINPLQAKADTIPALICLVISLLAVKLMPPIIVLLTLWASFLLLTSVGQPAKLSQARSMLLYAIIGAVVIIMAVPLVSLVGSAIGGGISTTECNPANAVPNAITVLVNIINWFSWLLAILSVAMGLYAGFLYMTAKGEPQKVATANSVLVYTVIGVVVAILAFSIKTIINAFIVP